MSKAKGFPLSRKWHYMSHKDKSKVLHQLGKIIWQLSRLPFGQIGSLFEDKSGLQVRTCLGRGMVIYDRDLLEDIDRGPFLTPDAYFKALTSVLSDHAQCLRLEHHCFFAPIPLQEEYAEWSQYQAACDRWNDFAALGDRIDCAPNRMDYVIAGDLLSEMIAEWLKNAPGIRGSSSQQPQQFYLRHPDLSVNNIFIDDQYRITCLIDWGFCSTVPLPVLLTAPGLPQARDKLEEPLISAFEEGLRLAAFDVLQDGDLQEYYGLCEAIQHSRPIWFLSRLLDFDSIQDFNHFRELWRSIGPKDKEISNEFRARQAAPYYRQLYEEMKEEEPSAERISRHERECFTHEPELRLSISRKLSLVSDWRSRYEESSSNHIRRNADVFVADRKLWRWIGACLAYLHCNAK